MAGSTHPRIRVLLQACVQDGIRYLRSNSNTQSSDLASTSEDAAGGGLRPATGPVPSADFFNQNKRDARMLHWQQDALQRAAGW